MGPDVGYLIFHQVHPRSPGLLQTPVLLHSPQDQVKQVVSPVPM